MAKEGSTVSGLMDAFATSISIALQHGVPLKVLCEKFAHTRFEPSGWTGNEQIGYAKSLMDYIFRWLNLRFLSGTQLTLFAGLAPACSATARLAQHDCRERAEKEPEPIAQGNLAKLAEEVARRLNQVSSPAGGSGLEQSGTRAAASRPSRMLRQSASPAPPTGPTWPTAASTTPPTPCATCTRWATPPVARPAAPSWSATAVATAA